MPVFAPMFAPWCCMRRVCNRLLHTLACQHRVQNYTSQHVCMPCVMSKGVYLTHLLMSIESSTFKKSSFSLATLPTTVPLRCTHVSRESAAGPPPGCLGYAGVAGCGTPCCVAASLCVLPAGAAGGAVAGMAKPCVGLPLYGVSLGCQSAVLGWPVEDGQDCWRYSGGADMRANCDGVVVSGDPCCPLSAPLWERDTGGMGLLCALLANSEVCTRCCGAGESRDCE